MSPQLSLAVGVVSTLLCSLSLLVSSSPSSVLDSYNKVLNKNGRDKVGMGCKTIKQWEIARLMEGLTGKKAGDDLTDEEEAEVNEEFVKKALEMCSLRHELYCLNNTDSAGGTCASCQDLPSQPSSPLKDMNSRLCNYAKKVAETHPPVKKEKEQVRTTISPPRKSQSCGTLDGSLTKFLTTALLVMPTTILRI